MKKLLFSLMIGFAQLGFSQGANCAAATNISANGTFAIAAVTGTYVGPGCPAGSPSPAATAAVWYKFTPTATGVVTISSDLPANDGVTKSDETRLSIYSGTCASLVCAGGNDDVTGSNYLSTATVNVTAGTTYYIQWDNSWGATLGFDFTYSFTAVSCLPVSTTGITLTNITNTTATIGWTAVSGAASYDIEYGAPGFVQGTGTIVNTTTPSATITFPTAGGNYNFYLRSNCGVTQSTWVGPYAIFLAKNAPYSNNFDDSTNRADGFAGSGNWLIAIDSPGVTVSHTPTAFYYSNNSATVPSNSQIYTRPLNLIGGATNTATFYARLYAFDVSAGVPGIAAPMTLNVYRNTTRSLTGATQIGTTIIVNGVSHTQYTSSFTVPTTGTYYLIYSNETPAVTGATNTTALIYDTFAITSTALSVNDIVKNDTNLSIYPNPVSDVLNIKSKDKVKSVEIYDMTGRKINAELNNNSINVKVLQSGSYILSVETSNGKSTQKFIKK